MKRKPKLTRVEKQERLFKKRIASIFQNMRRRMDGLPFSLDTFRKKMFLLLVYQDGVTVPFTSFLHCPYCSETLTAKTFSVDHVLPISRGGKKGLKNLGVVCARCNRAKADLTQPEYAALVVFLRGLGPDAERSVLRRLRASPPWLR